MNYKVAKHVDYISCSVSSFMIADEAFGRWYDAPPRQKNYNKAKIFDCGVYLQWHTEHANMKINIVLSGSTLAQLRIIGFTDYDIIHWLKSMPNCKFSRIDIAVTSERIDGKEHELLPHKLHYLAMNGLLVSKMKVDNPAVDPELKVLTHYVGSRKSRNRLFRAYDKGLERGESIDFVARYELETRKNATHVANELHDKHVDVGAVIRRYVDFPQVELWCEILGADIAPNYRVDLEGSTTQIEREKHNARLSWLFSSVAPALAKVLDYEDSQHGTHGSDEIMRLLTDYVAYHRANS